MYSFCSFYNIFYPSYCPPALAFQTLLLFGVSPKLTVEFVLQSASAHCPDPVTQWRNLVSLKLSQGLKPSLSRDSSSLLWCSNASRLFATPFLSPALSGRFSESAANGTPWLSANAANTRAPVLQTGIMAIRASKPQASQPATKLRQAPHKVFVCLHGRYRFPPYRLTDGPARQPMADVCVQSRSRNRPSRQPKLTDTFCNADNPTLAIK